MNNTDDCEALIFACGTGNPAAVSRLVQVPGLDINYQTEIGRTAAFFASVHRNTECLRILAGTGRVDWNKADKQGRTPLFWALMYGDSHSEIVDIIMQQPNIDCNVKSEFGYTLGHAAISGGVVKCVETLAAQERFECWNG